MRAWIGSDLAVFEQRRSLHGNMAGSGHFEKDIAHKEGVRTTSPYSLLCFKYDMYKPSADGEEYVI